MQKYEQFSEDLKNMGFKETGNYYVKSGMKIIVNDVGFYILPNFHQMPDFEYEFNFYDFYFNKSITYYKGRDFYKIISFIMDNRDMLYLLNLETVI